MLNHRQKQRYISGWLKRKEERQAQLKEQQRLALEKAFEIAQMLKAKYGARKVVLFGSLVKGKYWRHSDIDIAVHGIDESRYLDAAWEASQIALPFKVDLLPLESVAETLKRKIEDEGLVM
ncbi:MAG: nucleotidyltransferase domain-containing protein [Syntrophothermus sp.]|uniref:nucleotidyltransferase family protein n=1 Tax=Syntrophothermus sp. TaxID=2736299 RepID=UPI00257E5431|nr:nucleotidyltransferase domain-containing protein [Syntrophothermus sp.]NSW84579.1 nucleotidyltransferase domain-containing protein [Syntrophothermus sp.]